MNYCLCSSTTIVHCSNKSCEIKFVTWISVWYRRTKENKKNHRTIHIFKTIHVKNIIYTTIYMNFRWQNSITNIHIVTECLHLHSSSMILARCYFVASFTCTRDELSSSRSTCTAKMTRSKCMVIRILVWIILMLARGLKWVNGSTIIERWSCKRNFYW